MGLDGPTRSDKARADRPVALNWYRPTAMGDRDGGVVGTGHAHRNPLCCVGKSHLDIDLSLHMFPLVFLFIAPQTLFLLS